MARGMVPACRDNHPRSRKENHPKTSPDRLTEADLLLIYGLTRFPGYSMRSFRGMPAYKTVLRRLSMPKMTQAMADPFTKPASAESPPTAGTAMAGGCWLKRVG
jgi:hypothetical protein